MMRDFLWTAASGWVGVLIFIVGLALPYVFRRMQVKSPYLRRLWPHYWLGYALPLVVIAHAWIPMRSGNMSGLNTTGLWLATGALFLSLSQVALGLLLRDPIQSGRRVLKQVHFWSMVSLSVFIAAHIAFNKP